MPYHAASNSAEHRPGNAIFILHRDDGLQHVATSPDAVVACIAVSQRTYLPKPRCVVFQPRSNGVQTGHCHYASTAAMRFSSIPANSHRDLFTGIPPSLRLCQSCKRRRKLSDILRGAGMAETMVCGSQAMPDAPTRLSGLSSYHLWADMAFEKCEIRQCTSINARRLRARTAIVRSPEASLIRFTFSAIDAWYRRCTKRAIRRSTIIEPRIRLQSGSNGGEVRQRYQRTMIFILIIFQRLTVHLRQNVQRAGRHLRAA